MHTGSLEVLNIDAKMCVIIVELIGKNRPKVVTLSAGYRAFDARD